MIAKPSAVWLCPLPSLCNSEIGRKALGNQHVINRRVRQFTFFGYLTVFGGAYQIIVAHRCGYSSSTTGGPIEMWTT